MKPGLKIPFLVLVCSIFATGVLAQNTGMYSPLQDDPTIIQQLTEATCKRYLHDLDNISGEHPKHVEQLYKERYLKIRRLYSDREIIAEATAATYLQWLAKEIIDNNPALNNLETRIVFSRAWWPNATSMGEGTIVFNIGLFTRLENESQVAFVLCHELAHLYLRHCNTNMARYVNTVNSEEFQKEYSRIQKSEFQKHQQAEALVKNLAFSSRRHSREHETEADSLAIEWMKNTSFDVRESLTCLALLDSVDSDKYDINPELHQVFQFKEYPMQAQWAKQDETVSGAASARTEEDEIRERDSLKTHPDCSNRIKRIAGRVQQYHQPGSKAFVVSEAIFKKLQQDFDYEIIEYCFRSGNISRSLYYSLQMLQAKRSDPWLVTSIGRCLNEIYRTNKARTLAMVVEQPSPYHDKKYDKLLRFIHQLRLQDIAAISYFYLLVYQREYAVHEEFLEALITSKINFNKPEEKKYWVDQYHKQFPNGRDKF